MFSRLSITAMLLALSTAPAFAGAGGGETAAGAFMLQVVSRLIEKIAALF